MRLVLFLVLLTFASAAASAQPAGSVAAQADSAHAAAPRPASWVSVSGYAATASTIGASVQGHIPLGRGPVVVQIGLSGASSFFGGDLLTEGHVTLGASASAGPLLLTATAGPSLGSAFSRTRRQDVTVVGASVGVQARVVVFPFLGIGAEAFTHVNAVRPVSGVGFHLSFGRLPGALVRHTPPTPRRPGP